ncbi:MAG: putative sugar nucleotidyl transferase, partial [Bacteroidota bacterium]
MEKILFEDNSHFNLLPLTFTRPLYELRAGIFTFKERWTHIYGEEMYAYAYDYLGAAFNKFPTHNEPCLWINGKIVPDNELLKEIEDLGPSTYLSNTKDEVIAARFPLSLLPVEFSGILDKDLLDGLGLKEVSTQTDSLAIRQAPDMFLNNEKLIAYDFELVTRTRTS